MRFHAHQSGAVTLVMALVLLTAMSVLTLAGARIAINKQRITANTAHAQHAFYTAEAGIDNAIAYVRANHTRVASTDTYGWLHASSSPKWQPCSTSLTAVPCGDGTSNLYGSDWQYYGPVPNLAAAEGDYTYSVWALSDTLTDPPPTNADLGCLNLGLTALLPSVTGVLVGTVNGLLNTLFTLLGLPVMNLPSNLCLPLNFSGNEWEWEPSSMNPNLRLVSEATHPADVLGGRAQTQQELATSSLFAAPPMAPLMVDGTVDLTGDIRVFGNPRPPTTPPYDWSVLNLNDVLGLNVTSLLDTHLNSGHAATLAPLLNLTTAEVLALDWNVTFPLSIWSHANTKLHAAGVGAGILSSARTCTPPYDGTTDPACLTLSQQVDIPAGSIALFTPLVNINLKLFLPDIQDEHNLVSVVSGLLDTSSPVDFPDDVMAHIFGVAATDYADLQADSVQLSNCSSLNSASTGMYWITGGCTISGTVGSASSAPIVFVNGHLTLADGAHFSGLLFLRGPSATKIIGPSSPAVRPTVLGAIVSEDKIIGTGNFNLVYDWDRIRTAGYSAGEFTRQPGGWSDSLTGP